MMAESTRFKALENQLRGLDARLAVSTQEANVFSQEVKQSFEFSCRRNDELQEAIKELKSDLNMKFDILITALKELKEDYGSSNRVCSEISEEEREETPYLVGDFLSIIVGEEMPQFQPEKGVEQIFEINNLMMQMEARALDVGMEEIEESDLVRNSEEDDYSHTTILVASSPGKSNLNSLDTIEIHDDSVMKLKFGRFSPNTEDSKYTDSKEKLLCVDSVRDLDGILKLDHKNCIVRNGELKLCAFLNYYWLLNLSVEMNDKDGRLVEVIMCYDPGNRVFYESSLGLAELAEVDVPSDEKLTHTSICDKLLDIVLDFVNDLELISLKKKLIVVYSWGNDDGDSKVDAKNLYS